MFLCERCHDEGKCHNELITEIEREHKSCGACERCGVVTGCYDCHNYDFRNPKLKEQ